MNYSTIVKQGILALLASFILSAEAQITVQKDYSNNYSKPIGQFQSINFREGGFSGLFPIPNTNGKEFWTLSDRGVNIDGASANTSTCRPTYDKIFSFPSYSPKIHRIRIQGDSVQILQSITIKRPDGTGATGILNPTGFGSTAAELVSTDTVLNCANFSKKTAAKDVWALDCEGLVVDKDGNFWVCEENGPTIWKLNPNGIVINRYSPYANLIGAQPEDLQIDTCFKYRKNNRGFENITIAPNGKIYALIQSPLLYPNSTVGQATRVHRLLEIDPITNLQKMYAYLNDGIIGAAGSNQIRLQDWKLGDMAAINDTTFLVLEAAARGTSDIKRLYKISLNGATVVKSGFSYSAKTLENLADSLGLATAGVIPVKKTLVMDLLANGWPAAYDKAEGLAIINDSTIAICNDNDFMQTCPLANGIALPTTTTSHVVIFNFKGKNKLVNFIPGKQLLIAGLTGPSTSTSPYLTPMTDGVNFTSILSAGEAINGYKMAGVPDGMGAYDNNDGTFTVLINHELGSTSGVTRAHGSVGAFMSKWIIKKSDLSVVSGQDLIKNLYLWTPTGYVISNATTPNAKGAINRFCSGDLAMQTAFYNPISGLGSKERLFLNGEEAGAEGRAFAHILTGSAAGNSYELPQLGKFSWENAVANPNVSDNTIVVGTDDATPGQVYVYVGLKTASGSEIDKAGLTNGKLYGIAVSGLTTEVSTSFPAANTAFSLVDLGTVRDSTGAALNTLSNAKSVTNFLRPEDGSWDPTNLNDFYFATTNSITAPSRLWRLRFSDINNPTKGGTITAVLDGTEGQKMFDNLTVDNSGHVFLQEDVGNNIHNGKIWQYTIATDKLELLAKHDPNRFETGASNYLTIDEESSGIIDAQAILGPGQFLLVDQAHYLIPGEVVEGGQLLSAFIPETFKNNPEVSITGNSMEIILGDTTPSVSDNTDFGASSITNLVLKSFVIKNSGIGNLTISKMQIVGIDAANFSIISNPSSPITIAPNAIYTVTVKFAPKSAGSKKAVLVVSTNDYDELRYDFRISGTGFIQGTTGVSTTTSPYLVGTAPGVSFTSLLSAGDYVGNYIMAGVPDGVGAFDNNDGTFTVVMNHELGSTTGGTRAHGSVGSFVSRWNINKSNLSVISGEDQIKNVFVWSNGAYTKYNASNPNIKATFNRFCSGDLAATTAYFNRISGKGSSARIYLNGEEAGVEGRSFAHILTGSENGNTYELPYLGKFSWENAVANPYEQDKTIVVGTDDATPGQVYVYIGNKSNSGNEVEKAGLSKGKLYGISVSGLPAETSATLPNPNTAFTLVDLGNIVDSSGFQLNRYSNTLKITNFLRPEDGTWDQSNLSDFYFVTTNSITAPSRLWKLHFDDITNPEKGGTITAMLDGTEGQKMMDNIGSDNSGHLIIQEDVGNNIHNGKIYQYTIASDKLEQIAQHDPSRFESNGSNFLTIDEESSGVIDAQSILGPGMFLLVDQAHYTIAGEVVEGGQLLTMYNPTSSNSNPEFTCSGNGIEIINQSSITTTINNTNMGSCGLSEILTAKFTVSNKGKGNLVIKSANTDNTNNFTVVNKLPMTIAADSSTTISVEFKSNKLGEFTSKVFLMNNDLDESNFEFTIAASVVAPNLEVRSLNAKISDGDEAPTAIKGTDFGQNAVGKSASKKFTITNSGPGILNVKGINISGSTVFSVSSGSGFPIQLNKSSQLEFTITALTTQPTMELATVSILTNASDSVFNFKVSAEGTAPLLNIFGNSNPVQNGNLNPNKFNQTHFGLVGLGYLKTNVFQLENSGKDLLLIDSITLSGTNKAEFKVAYPGSSKFSILGGKTENLMIEFATETMGLRSATVTIYSNAYNNGKYVFGISAEGTTPSGTTELQEADINVYPIPANEIIDISSPNAEITALAVTNVAGANLLTIHQNQISDRNTVRIPTNEWPNGIYLLEIQVNNQSINKKIIIAH